MRIVGIMAVHGRREITLATLRMLQERQTMALSHILIMGGPEERDYAAEVGCDFLEVPNQPLGRKYQAGLFWSRVYDPDAIVILQSDTWLNPYYVERAALIVRQQPDRWFGMYRWNPCKVARNQPLMIRRHVQYSAEYRQDPVGAGRVFPRTLSPVLRLNFRICAIDT